MKRYLLTFFVEQGSRRY